MNAKSARCSIARRAGTAAVASDHAAFVAGDPVWVMAANGVQRRAEYLGARVASVWRAGPPMVFVLYMDSHSVEAVEMDRVIPRRTGSRSVSYDAP
jgi:hypothetical protein